VEALLPLKIKCCYSELAIRSLFLGLFNKNKSVNRSFSVTHGMYLFVSLHKSGTADVAGVVVPGRDHEAEITKGVDDRGVYGF